VYKDTLLLIYVNLFTQHKIAANILDIHPQGQFVLKMTMMFVTMMKALPITFEVILMARQVIKDDNQASDE